MIKLIACHKTSTADQAAMLFNNAVLSMTGLPLAIISDRDPKFTSRFWKTLHMLLGTRLAFSTAHHAQTDGLAERSIGTLEEMIRTYCCFGTPVARGDFNLDWVALLPQLEFAYNSSLHATTKQIPFQVAYGWVPHSANSLWRVKAELRKDVAISSDARDFFDIMTKARKRAEQCIEHAHEVAKKRWDKSHKEIN